MIRFLSRNVYSASDVTHARDLPSHLALVSPKKLTFRTATFTLLTLFRYEDIDPPDHNWECSDSPSTPGSQRPTQYNSAQSQ